MWLFSVFFLVDDSKLTCLGRGQNETFVPRLTAAAKQQICYSNWTQTPPPLLSSVDCRVDSGPNARFKSQVKPVASDGPFKEAEPSSFPEPNKEVLVKHVVFSIQVWLFLLRFCPLFSADSALDWSRTLWWFWFWLAWIFSHIQLSNFTPVQLKTWWNSQIHPTSENTNRRRTETNFTDRVRSYKSSVRHQNLLQGAITATVRHSLARSQAWLCTTRLVQTTVVNNNQCGSTQLDPTAPVESPESVQLPPHETPEDSSSASQFLSSERLLV